MTSMLDARKRLFSTTENEQQQLKKLKVDENSYESTENESFEDDFEHEFLWNDESYTQGEYSIKQDDDDSDVDEDDEIVGLCTKYWRGYENTTYWENLLEFFESHPYLIDLNLCDCRSDYQDLWNRQIEFLNVKFGLNKTRKQWEKHWNCFKTRLKWKCDGLLGPDEYFSDLEQRFLAILKLDVNNRCNFENGLLIPISPKIEVARLSNENIFDDNMKRDYIELSSIKLDKLEETLEYHNENGDSNEFEQTFCESPIKIFKLEDCVEDEFDIKLFTDKYDTEDEWNSDTNNYVNIQPESFPEPEAATSQFTESVEDVAEYVAELQEEDLLNKACQKSKYDDKWTFLLKFMADHTDFARGNCTNIITNKKLWQELVDQLNAQCSKFRSLKTVKNAWRDLKMRLKMKIKNRKPLSDIDKEVIAILGLQS